MSFVDNFQKEKRSYVITYKEILFTVVVFSIILTVLYPKKLIQSQIMAETSNYDLSIVYLKNLLKQDPNNKSLMLSLASQSLKTGQYEIARRLLNKLEKSKDKDNKFASILLSYKLYKDLYFKPKTKNKDKIKQKLSKLFDDIIRYQLYSKSDYRKWYQEAVFLDKKEMAYIFLKEIIAKENPTLDDYKNGYGYAIFFKDYTNALKYVNILLEKDKDPAKQKIYKNDKYYILLNSKNYNELERFLTKEAKTSLKYEIRLADFYFMTKKYKTASKLYFELYKTLNDNRIKYLKKSITSLLSGGYLNEAANLAHKYEKVYINDKDFRQFILKIYLSANRLDYARSLSNKILKKEYN
jgi:thioredoxin-like negative regulator of GroEL